ncbi:hypothetical protein RhiXN_01048 [Rhizoctonia solani]|uniref:Small EDRK-rich factor-like N-terminal domain-containing protein n=1 Tax=Rhizoctonia solani TaxID=456999 RepID=A0A8H8NVS2_9AGAM|nr:uncharacterized protein RhiXN_01048 [Rhizoctonia solani]QRW19642.1 hypothetical protein RhiXN_01048 [Rhizoctonia solani]
MGNGAKAQQKQQRNAKKAADAGPKRRVNSSCGEAIPRLNALNVSQQSFLTTTRLPALTQHVENKHSGKTMADCFPNYKE